MITGRELPPVAVLAVDQKLTGRARQLRKLGVPGGMDELRARVPGMLGRSRPVGDLDKDSHGDAGDDDGGSGSGSGSGGRGPEPGETDPAGPGRVAATIHLTAPVTTLTEMAGWPGTLRGTGPIDPEPGANTPGRY